MVKNCNVIAVAYLKGLNFNISLLYLSNEAQYHEHEKARGLRREIY